MNKTIFVLIFLISGLLLKAQEGCEKQNHNFNKFFSIDNRIISDRFYHSINPRIARAKFLQLESGIFLRDEYLNKDKSSSTFNIYSNYKLTHTLFNDFDFFISLNDLIIRSGDEKKILWRIKSIFKSFSRI